MLYAMVNSCGHVGTVSYHSQAIAGQDFQMQVTSVLLFLY